MTEQEELIQEIRKRLGEMPKEVLPFDLLAFCHHYRRAPLDDAERNHSARYE